MMRIDRRSQQGGFVLVLVLALLVVLALLAAAVAVAGSRAVDEAQAELDRFQGEVDMVSTRDTLLYMLSVQFRTLGGVTVDDAKDRAVARMREDLDTDGNSVLPVGNEIRLDSTPYRGVGRVLFALQDDRGLVSPNWSSDLVKQRFYAAAGVPQQEWAALESKRLDYQDPDDLHRLDGGEKDDYTKAGLPPPSNRALASPLELRRVLGWNRMLAGHTDEQLLGMFTMARSAEINVNTAPPSVLELLPGMDPAQVERLVAMRQQMPLSSRWQLAELVPTLPAAVVEDMVTLFSNESGTLTLWDAQLGTKRLAHWTLTPYRQGRTPWRIDYEVILPRGNHPDQPVARTPPSPLFAPEDVSGEPGQPAPARG